MSKEIMWIVKMEVLAKNITEAAKKPGRVYAIEEASKDYQPEDKQQASRFQKRCLACLMK